MKTLRTPTTTRSSALRRGRLVTVLPLTVFLGLAGCSSSSPSDDTVPETVAAQTEPSTPDTTATSPTTQTDATSAATGPKLNQEQATRLSRTLFLNHQNGGASVVGTFEYGPAATFVISGEVDWTNANGAVTIATKRSDGVAVADQRAAWSKGLLFLEVPGLEAKMAEKGRPGISWMSRPVDPRTVPLDQAITYLASLATDRADNPLLLRQGDTSFEGKDTVAGTPVDRLRFQKTTFLVAANGALQKVETRFKSFAGPITVEVTNPGPRTIALPSPDAIVPLDEIRDIYAELNAKR